MKFATYVTPAGQQSYGVVEQERVSDIPTLWSAAPATLRELLIAGLDTLPEAVTAGETTYGLDEVTFAPVVPDAAKNICVGLNYATHVSETGRDSREHPPVFLRFADTHVGHGVPVRKPAVTEALDYEGELVAIIGRDCYQVDVDHALDYVAGYSCYNDLSARDWQRHTSQFTPGKNFLGVGAFGPWLVTADEIADPQRLQLTTTVNGEVRQSANTSTMIFSVAEIVAYLSTFTPLAPGDVVVTGTPGGVGLFRDPPTFLLPGDEVEVRIDGVGTLTNLISG